MKQRPFAILILGWLFIAIGAVSLAMDVRFAFTRGGGIDEAWIFLVHVKNHALGFPGPW